MSVAASFFSRYKVTTAVKGTESRRIS